MWWEEYLQLQRKKRDAEVTRRRCNGWEKQKQVGLITLGRLRSTERQDDTVMQCFYLGQGVELGTVVGPFERGAGWVWLGNNRAEYAQPPPQGCH